MEKTEKVPIFLGIKQKVPISESLIEEGLKLIKLCDSEKAKELELALKDLRETSLNDIRQKVPLSIENK